MTASYLLVGNPTAQTGRAKERIERVLESMRTLGMPVEFLSTLPNGKTVDAVRQRVDTGREDVIVYMGGDGTFAEVAKGILAAKSPKPMGMLPSGTANDQGKSFGIASTPEALVENLQIIRAGHVTHLDVGQVTKLVDGRPLTSDKFFDCAGWGIQAEVLELRNRDREVVDQIPIVRDLYRDQAVYMGAAINRYFASWIEPTKFTANVEIDGRTTRFEGLTDLIVNGTDVYAGAWVLDREAKPDDGLMELVPMIGRRDMFSKAVRDLMTFPIWQEHLDALGLSHSKNERGARFEIRMERSDRPEIAGQIDGEEWFAGRHFLVEVLANALPLITRSDFRAPWHEPLL